MQSCIQQEVKLPPSSVSPVTQGVRRFSPFLSKELEERIRIQLTSEIRGVETRLIRWIFAMGVATITVLAALIKLLR
jgi:hypothetical protein